MTYEQAEVYARSQMCKGRVYRVEDKWGGYWQVLSPYGPYNFRGTKLDE
jgi:hypothetical protein